jgi:DNA excision repair protein ERCC-3
VPDGPLIVQSDKTMLLEVDHPAAPEARAAIAPFAELERAPEHVHTYRITPLSLWNARAAGMSAEEMQAVLLEHSRFPVPGSILTEIADQVARYGRLRLEKQDGSLRLVTEEPAILEEVSRAKSVAPLLAARLGPGMAEIRPLDRGRLKQVLIKLGWPVEDLAGYTPGAPLTLGLR